LESAERADNPAQSKARLSPRRECARCFGGSADPRQPPWEGYRQAQV